MFCTFCGSQIADGLTVCPNCHNNLNGGPQNKTNTTYNGIPQPPTYNQASPYNPYQPQFNPYGNLYMDYSDASTGMKILSFFIPLVGIVLYLCDRDRKPNSAKSCLKMSLISIGICVVLWLLWFLFVIVIATTGISNSNGMYEQETRIYYGLINSFLPWLHLFF